MFCQCRARSVTDIVGHLVKLARWSADDKGRGHLLDVGNDDFGTSLQMVNLNQWHSTPKLVNDSEGLDRAKERCVYFVPTLLVATPCPPRYQYQGEESIKDSI